MAEQLTHYRKLQNPDYLGVYALEVDKDIVGTIAKVGNELVTGPGGKKEECTVIHFKESGMKPMIANSTNLKMMAKLFKSSYIEKWVGGRIQIYADYNVKFGNDIVEGLRIRSTLPEPEKPICSRCNSNISQAGKLTALQVAAHTQRTYGMPLCAKCATAEKAAREAATVTDVLSGTDAPTTESTVTGQVDAPVNETNIEGENNVENN